MTLVTYQTLLLLPPGDRSDDVGPTAFKARCSANGSRRVCTWHQVHLHTSNERCADALQHGAETCCRALLLLFASTRRPCPLATACSGNFLVASSRWNRAAGAGAALVRLSEVTDWEEGGRTAAAHVARIFKREAPEGERRVLVARWQVRGGLLHLLQLMLGIAGLQHYTCCIATCVACCACLLCVGQCSVG